MNTRAIVERLDGLLKPLGFTRRKSAWNREAGSVVEVIDVQTSKAGDRVTLNAGVLDRDVYLTLWGKEPAAFIEEPECTVGARVGTLVEGRDLWWSLEDDSVGASVIGATQGYVLPFLERMRSRQEMVKWLTDGQVVKKRYPPPIMNLAILLSFLGKESDACALLEELHDRAVGAWRTRAIEVARRLGCAATWAGSLPVRSR